MILARGLYSLIFVLLFSIHSNAQPYPVPHDAQCDECDMYINKDSKFIGQAVDKDEKKLFFCDIGDMLYHFRKGIDSIKSVHVRDFVTGEWIDGKKALYVFNKKFNSPMSWNIAAFSSDSDAKKWGEFADFKNAFKFLN